jgi:hypothetical protein
MNYFILFDSPYFQNMWKYELNKKDIEKLENLENKDSENCLTNLVVESKYSLKSGRWKPIRIRYDKEYPNNYNVGLTNTSLLFDPPFYKEGSYVFKNVLNDYIKTFIWDYITIHSEEYLPFSKEPIILFDYNANSSDVINYYDSNVRKIFAINNDKTELVNYVEILRNVYTNSSKHKHIINLLNQVKQPRITINVFEKDNFREKILESNDFNLHEINVVYFDNLNSSNNVDIEELRDFYDICNVDYVIIYIYVGGGFNKFYDEYRDYIIHYFNPFDNEQFIQFLHNNGLNKKDYENYNVWCNIIKFN